MPFVFQDEALVFHLNFGEINFGLRTVVDDFREHLKVLINRVALLEGAGLFRNLLHHLRVVVFRRLRFNQARHRVQEGFGLVEVV